MARPAWVVNTSDREISVMDMSLKKEIVFKPNVPIPLPVRVAVMHVKKHSLRLTNHPEKYFVDREFRHLIVRDAGIGDLLMLESIIRALSQIENHAISVYSRYPEVFMYNPALAENISMDKKEVLDIDVKAYDVWDDLRNYSETCANRERLHRTDCYNQVFGVELKDPEPRIYIGTDEKPFLKRKEGKKYIGLCCDASHTYRRYEEWKELGEKLLAQDKNNVLVLLGADRYMKLKKFGSGKVVDLQGKTDPRELILTVRDLDALVSVDSGPMHIAMAMHIPTVGIFSIIKPELRVHYYQGPREIVFRRDLPCAGCGSLHMEKCRFGNKKTNPEFVPPCLQFNIDDIVKKMAGMRKGIVRTYSTRVHQVAEITVPEVAQEPSKGIRKPADKVDIPQEPTEPPQGPQEKTYTPERVRTSSGAKKTLTMPIMVQNEEKNLPRFIELVMSHPSIGRVVAIDGGSTDKTVKLLEKAGAEVYVHPYLQEYHDMQAMQRNISCSYVREGTPIIIMDLDECFSKALSDYLPALVERTEAFIEIPRRTFEYYKDISDPAKAIKDYPDWQPRFYRWEHKFKFIRSPHHITVNVPHAVRLEKGLDIIHFEREGKDREALEAKWGDMWKRTGKVYLP